VDGRALRYDGNSFDALTEETEEMTNRAYTIVATVAATADADVVEREVRAALQKAGVPLVACNWSPDPDTIADQTPDSITTVIVLDLNDRPLLPQTLLGVPQVPVEPLAELTSAPSTWAALEAATRLVTAAMSGDITSREMIAEYETHLADLGGLAKMITDLAEFFVKWVDDTEQAFVRAGDDGE
jgi:hypothetical protein